MNDFGTFDTQMLGITEDQIREVDASEAEVVSRVLTPRVKDIIVTFRPDGITFNATCIRSMIDVCFVQIYIDRKQHRMYVSPCREYDQNSKQWCNQKNGTRTSRKITGRPFGNKAYSMMGWSKGYSYRVIGYPARQVDTDDEFLLVFDLDVFDRTLLTGKGMAAAGVKKEDLGEDADQIQAEMERVRLEKKKAREEARETGQRNSVRKKVEYYDGVAGEAFGPQKKDYSQAVEVRRLEELEPFFTEDDGQAVKRASTESDKKSARLQEAQAPASSAAVTPPYIFSPGSQKHEE